MTTNLEPIIANMANSPSSAGPENTRVHNGRRSRTGIVTDEDPASKVRHEVEPRGSGVVDDSFLQLSFFVAVSETLLGFS